MKAGSNHKLEERERLLLPYHISKRQIQDGFIAMFTAVLWSTIIIQTNYGICNFAKQQIFIILSYLLCVIYYLYCAFYMSRPSHSPVRYRQRGLQCLVRRRWFAINHDLNNISILFKSSSFSALYIGIELSKFRMSCMSSSVGSAGGTDRNLYTYRLHTEIIRGASRK